jgi:dolichol-phosphate mannosyltransferase
MCSGGASVRAGDIGSKTLADLPARCTHWWRATADLRIVAAMSARLWLFVPTYNEVATLESMVRATIDQLELVAPGDWRLLVVDDDSPDGTGGLADRLSREIDGVEVLHRTGKQGLGKAYLAGFQHSLARGAELVIVMDADLSHDPAHLPAMIEAARHSDLVLGSRYVPGGEVLDWPRLRRVLSRSGSLYARTILGVKVRDLTSGFRCVRRRVLETVEPSTLRAQGYVFNIELTYRALLAGFTVTEVPISFRDREAGESKMSLPIAVEALMLVPQLRGLRRRPGVLGLPGAESAGESAPRDGSGEDGMPEARPDLSRPAR